jgi:VCBS repeat-containing protein
MLKKNSKFVLLISLVVVIALGVSALGPYSEILWLGHGTDSLNCTKYGPEGGMHWVLTESSKVTVAMIVLNGDIYPLTKRSGPVIHFDTPYYEIDGLEASVIYTGAIGKNGKLVLSDYCPGYVPLEAQKTAEGTYDRTVEWKLEKFVDPISHTGLIGQTLGESIWTVVATKDETLDNYKVTGDITITNPNVFPVPFSVEDLLDDGTVANVVCPATVVPAKDSLVCTYEAYPPDASATLNTATVKAYVGDAVAEADVVFTENLIGYDEGTLKDPLFDYEKVIGASTTATFNQTFVCSSDTGLYENGKYEYKVVNWAYLNGNLDLKASAEVTVTCILPPLEVTKTAAGEWDRTVTWKLDKSVSPATFSGLAGDAFSSVWKVVATKEDTSPTNYRVFGEIIIYNPAPITQVFTVADVLSGAREDWVTVVCPVYAVAPGATVVCPYDVKQPDATATLNSVLVYAPGNKPQGDTAVVIWKENLYGYDEGTLKDPRFDYQKVIDASTTVTFDETFYCPPAESSLYVNGLYSFEVVNWAYLNGNLNLSDSAKVTVDCRKPKFQGETAWGGNTGFNVMSPGQWWYIFDTSQSATQTIWAGQTIPVGSVTVSEAVGGYRTISIYLSGGWILQSVSEPVKIQGYDDIPSDAPAPGGFATYKGSALLITVPDYAFYAIHLDVGIWK